MLHNVYDIIVANLWNHKCMISYVETMISWFRTFDFISIICDIIHCDTHMISYVQHMVSFVYDIIVSTIWYVKVDILVWYHIHDIIYIWFHIWELEIEIILNRFDTFGCTCCLIWFHHHDIVKPWYHILGYMISYAT